MSEPIPASASASGPDRSSGLEIRLLGGVRATGGDGPRSSDPLDVGPAKCQLLLAALALSPGSAVPVPRLVELVWGDDPPRTAEKTLQSYATQLRKALGADRVVRTGTAYRLDVEPEAVDVTRFERHLAVGDTAAALDEWAGPPLAGLDPAGLAAPVAGLVERWLGAVEAELAEAVDRDPAAVVGRLTELTADHPFREGLWALLMTALYASGRQAEALAAYRQARERLIDELGVEPGPRLQELEARILDHDADLDVHQPTAAPPGRSGTAGIPTGTVTFAFSDVEGSTRLWAADRDLTGRAIARHEAIVRAAAAEAGGHVFGTGGDSFGVAFDRADDAARWANAVQAGAAAEPWPEGAEIRIRIGMHTGDAEERDGNYFGPAVNLAARVADAGHGGQILLSTVTAALLSGGGLRAELRNLGGVELAGIDGEQTVYQLGLAEHPPLRAPSGRRGNLPRVAGPLLGRAELLDATVQALAASPVVTLVGPGGIGKTRLSLAAAELAAAELGAGAWLVELADVASPDDVVRAVADALDAKEVRGRSLVDTIVATVSTRRALLVLDNCEHVIDGAAELVEALTQAGEPGGQRVPILATSREGLAVAGEQLLAVGPLDVDGAAIELFARRAAAVDRTFDLDTHRETVGEICRRLDGVPLAIELAAARVRTLPPDDLVKRLDDSFRVLSGGRRRSVARHRTLRATIQWSHDLLSPVEQILFRRLAVFAGSFDLVAAERVTADDDPASERLSPDEVGSTLDDLVERSMVLVESGRSGRRFRLLETMRQFGSEQLADHDDPDALARRHAAYVADEIGDIAAQLDGWAELDAIGRLTDLWPNLRAAFDHAERVGDEHLAARLIGPVAAQAICRRGVTELSDWIERAMAMADPSDDEYLATGLLWAAFYYSMANDTEAFDRLVERHGPIDHVLARAATVAIVDEAGTMAEAAAETIGELERRGEHYLAKLFSVFEAGGLLGDGRLDEAEPKLAALVERFRADGPPTFYNWALYMAAAAADFRGESERAEGLYDQALAVEVPPLTNSPNDVLRARTLFRQGQHRRAFLVLQDYATELAETGNLSGVTVVAMEFINLATALDERMVAATALGYLDVTGMLDVEGPAFRLLVEDAAAVIDGDPAARAERQRAAAEGVDDRRALEIMLELLADLLAGRLAV